MSYITRYINSNSEDVRAVRKVIRALEAAGNPVVKVANDLEIEEVSTESEILEAVFRAGGRIALLAKGGNQAYVVTGNGYEDTLYDYSQSLEEVLGNLF